MERIEVSHTATHLTLTIGETVVSILKTSVKTIETVGTESVRLDIGQGDLGNVYLRMSELIPTPDTANTKLLSSALLDMVSSTEGATPKTRE